MTSLYVMNRCLRAKDAPADDPVIAGLIAKHWDEDRSRESRASSPEAQASSSSAAASADCSPRWARASARISGSTARLRASCSRATSRSGRDQPPDRGSRRFADGLGLAQARAQDPHEARRLRRISSCAISSSPPVKKNAWNATAALNVIDMLPDPADLPKLQHALLMKGGVAIQSCP